MTVWRAMTFSAAALISFFYTAFSVHCTPLLLLSLQFFLCSSGTLGCLRVWHFPLHFLGSDTAHPHCV